MKTTTEMAIYLWKRFSLIFSIDYPGSAPGITCWEERRKIFQNFSNFTDQVMNEYSEKGLNSSLPVLMVVKEYLKESLYSNGEESYKIARFLDEKYKDCGARWSAGGTYCCATSGATALINSVGEIFAYRLSWSNSTGSSGNSIRVSATEISLVTEALDNFNHFSGESWPDTNYEILPREDWRAVERKFKAYQEAKKIRLDYEARISWREGESFSFGITTRGGWYKPGAGVGLGKIVPQHEHDDSRTRLGRIKIMPCVPYGDYRFYIYNFPVYLSLVENTEPRLSLCASSSWCNSQSWWLDHHDSTNIERGWIFVDGEDVYESTLQNIKEKKAEKLAIRNTKFAEAKARAMNAGFTEAQISQIIKVAGNGQVIRMVNLAILMATKYSANFILQIINNLPGKSQDFIFSYAYLVAHATEIKKTNVEKAIKKAFSHTYLSSLIPGYGSGNFDEVMAALEFAIRNDVPFNDGTLKFGGENCESDLAVKLREAGLGK